MEGSSDREYSALGGLFHQIVSDMKNGIPLWEDLVIKASKLHSSLRATICAISSYLEAFQKIADAATNTRGATKEIGTALTRICLRHKAVEAKMKTFTSAIMDCLVVPLQEKLEDWKKTLISLDKEHGKDYKRAKSELRKRSSDTLRLQKKAKKSVKSDLQRQVECSLKDVYERKQILEEIEKKAVRSALIEERSRFCLLVAFLKPVVDEEVAMLSELSHLQEVVDQLEKHTAEPHSLPPASEQVINDLKSSDGWTFKTPPSSPGSLGSRKSSMCSISSINSSSSGSSKSHPSPSHHHWHRSISQVSNSLDQGIGVFQNKLSTSTSNIPEVSSVITDESCVPQRTPLAVYTSYTPDSSHSQPCSPLPLEGSGRTTPITVTQPSMINTRPPVPHRCSSLERPPGSFIKDKSQSLPKRSGLISSGGEVMLPMYVNMSELANLAATKAQEMNFPPPPPPSDSGVKDSGMNLHEKTESIEKDGSTSESSLESSSGYGSQTIQSNQEDILKTEGIYGTMRGSLLRHGSVHVKKPPPPIRRTSSISVSVRTSQFNLSNFSRGNSGSLENLPPPPAYLLDSSHADSIKFQNLIELSKRNCNLQKNLSLSSNSEVQRKFCKTSQKDQKVSSMYEPLQGTSVNVAETVRTLTELNHTPASPVSVRRSHSMRSQSADRKLEPGLIASLSAKLGSSRKISQDSSCSKATRIRQWIAGRTLPDPKVCHDSLMDQIKRGTVLRKTRSVNDRSAPRLFY